MPTGYTVKINGVDVDLDTIFAPKLPDTSPAPDVEFKSSNTDLSAIFEPITTANQQINFDVNYKKSGTDLRYIFADKNFTPTPTISVTPTLTPSGTPPVTPSISVSLSY
jgi:hypothetical protein